VLYAPRFQDDRIALQKQQTLQAMKQRNDNSAAIEGRETGFLANGENFWANHYSTSNSIDSITRRDLEEFHYQWFCPSNFIIAATGDFDRAEMIGKLEKVFAGGPQPIAMDKTIVQKTPPPIPTNITFAAAGVYFVNKPDVNQGRVSLMLPGITRDNPDYYAVIMMNDILGGGGFTSRIMNRIRSDEGLAYSAYSSFPGGVYYPGVFTIAFQSKSRTAAYAASIALEETKLIAAQPVSDEELSLAKKAFIASFPNYFNTKEKIAEQFARDEFTGRYAKTPQFWKTFRASIESVTRDDVARVAKKYLAADQFVVFIVGNEADILLGYPTHPVDLKTLFGKFHEWPLRDPLTMKPQVQ
jgi:predicted Zn-dependent peptidase